VRYGRPRARVGERMHAALDAEDCLRLCAAVAIPAEKSIAPRIFDPLNFSCRLALVPESSAAIDVEQLVREFRKGPRAVDGIDLTVSPGEIYGFLGPNGAGKSTTVLMLTTLLPPTSGRARVGGFDVVHQGSQVRSAIGAALQEAALDPILTGREHVMLQATLQGITKADRKARADALLERVGLTEAADRRVGGYSGGMKRRLDLALALVHSPRILFLDEPTTGLDPQSRSALWEEVARLAHDEGMTVFLTTQYLEEADVLADRVGIIDRGRIVAEGTPAQLKAEIGSPSVEILPVDAGAGDSLAQLLAGFGAPTRNGRGSVTVQLPDGEAQLAGVVRALDQADLHVASLQLHQPSLDDVFLAKTGRKLEGAAEQEPDEQQAPARRGRGRDGG
jgi:ABC-2 type transport system ATP-binding protein